MKFHLQALVLAAVLVATGAQAASIYDNLASSPDGADPILSYGPLANSFTTGADGTSFLTSISALFKNDSNSIVGDIKLSLHADAGNNTPGRNC